MTAYIESRRSLFGVEPVCRVVGVAASTHYAWLSRPASARAIRDAQLVGEIHQAREGYRSRYGVRKTWKQLRRNGVTDGGRERVARLMRQEGLRGVQRGRKPRTTIPEETTADRACDLVNRDFTAQQPNQLWVADFTYVRTWQGFSCLAFILDVYSRMIVGWQLATHMRSDLVVDALEMATGLRQPAAGELVAHSDHGSQYTSLHYTDRLDDHGIAPSLGSRGDAYDNAMAEAWVATYKSELPGRFSLAECRPTGSGLARSGIGSANHHKQSNATPATASAAFHPLYLFSPPTPCGEGRQHPVVLD